MENKKLSLLFPNGEEGFCNLNDIAVHDLGIDFLCEKVSDKVEEQQLFLRIFSKMSPDPAVTKYRTQVFNDIFENQEMCSRLMEILEKLNYLKEFGGFARRFEESDSAWELLHRLEEVNTYIKAVESIHDCLSGVELKSEGMKNLRNGIDSIYSENGFKELKKDISELKATTNDLKSITVGINLNEKFEAHGIGLISFNKKQFTKSSVIGTFATKIASRDQIEEEAGWDGSSKFYPIEAHHLDLFEKIISIADVGDKKAENSTYYMDKIANTLINKIVHKLKLVLKKYVYISITDVTDLIPEFIFFIRFADYIRSMKQKGFAFCLAEIPSETAGAWYMDARGIYNFKLVSAFADTTGPSEIVPNDLVFDSEHLCYILTGANRGGKTTITQAVGLLFVLAQAGLYVPGESFVFSPVDSIFTHFPADEDKTMDLGRLGEECRRFKELYGQATDKSLLLLNETYSTTSFEEGYYIARDSVRAILSKGIRTIYNTHMHKLAFDIDEINATACNAKASSLVVKAKEGKRSFKVEIAPPEGISFARDIAEKYGVTFEMLTGDSGESV